MSGALVALLAGKPYVEPPDPPTTPPPAANVSWTGSASGTVSSASGISDGSTPDGLAKFVTTATGSITSINRSLDSVGTANKLDTPGISGEPGNYWLRWNGMNVGEVCKCKLTMVVTGPGGTASDSYTVTITRVS